MIVVLSLLLIAFLVGIWLGRGFYRRVTAKATAKTATLPRFTRSRTNIY